MNLGHRFGIELYIPFLSMLEKSPIEMENPQIRKEKIRLEMRTLRRSLSQERRLDASLKLLELLDILSPYSQVFSFKSFSEEIDTGPLNKVLESQNKLYLPVMQGNEMRFFSHEKEASYTNSTIILVPGIAFDQNRHRLGYGKGHFDRFLAKMPHIPTIGIGFKEQLVEKLPFEAHDMVLSQMFLT